MSKNIKFVRARNLSKIISPMIAIILICCFINLNVYATGTEETPIEIKSNIINFSDVKPSDSYYDAVLKMIDLSIMTVGKDNKFNPNGVVTRATFSKMIVTLMGYSLTDGNTFTDTSKHWCRKYIETSAKQGLITTKEYGKAFKPDQPIKRVEIARVIARAIKLGENNDIIPFADVKNDGLVNSTFRYYIFRGEVKNKNRYFSPNDFLTRAQLASVLYKVYCFKSDKQNFLSTQKKLMLEDPTFVKATPDAEFESFMNSEKAVEFASTRYFRVEKGVVIFKDFGNEGYGELVLNDDRNRNLNKIMYNLTKDLVKYARKDSKYVNILYNPVVDSVIVHYYENRVFGVMEAEDGNITLTIKLKPDKFSEKQKYDSIYSWEINKLWEKIDETGHVADKDFVEDQYGFPLETMFNDIYGKVDGNALYNYALMEYRVEGTMGSKRENYSILKLNGYEIVNYNDKGFRIWFLTNLK